jgi:hypothetical protein
MRVDIYEITAALQGHLIRAKSRTKFRGYLKGSPVVKSPFKKGKV